MLVGLPAVPLNPVGADDGAGAPPVVNEYPGELWYQPVPPPGALYS